MDAIGEKGPDFGQSNSIPCWSGWQTFSHIDWLKPGFSTLTFNPLWPNMNSSHLFILGNTYFSYEKLKHAHTHPWPHPCGIRWGCRMPAFCKSSNASLWYHALSVFYHITATGSVLSSPISMDDRKLNNISSSNFCLFVLFFLLF